MKELVNTSQLKRIKHIQFSALTPNEIAASSEFQVFQRDLYNYEDRSPVKFGCLDRRLGISDKTNTCETCGQKLSECIGHFGHIQLHLPVFHIGFFKQILQVLQNICKSCSAVLLDEKDRQLHLARLRGKALDATARMRNVKAVNEKCKKATTCFKCGEANGVTKKIGVLKIVHEKFRHKKSSEAKEEFLKSFDNALEQSPELKAHLNKAQQDLNPLQVLQLFQALSDEDVEVMGLKQRPENFIWQSVPVPPICIRPSVAQESTSNEDDLTVKLTEIIFTNALVEEAIKKGASSQHLMEQWEFLQLTTAIYINSEMPGNPVQGRPIRSFCQRLKGKQGRFRGNLSGKRVDFSGRTVISPDPNLRLDQVAVPDRVAKILTYPERVTAHNIEKLRLHIINGPDVHPGANFLIEGSTGFKKFLKFGNRSRMANTLKPGDIVERHLSNGDVVLFNRQPSLHKLSIMAHFVQVKPWKTFRFNECVCNPYNADFDGDEMNLHVPQTEEARAEAIELMGVQHNLVTPRNGEPLVAATQDFISASYLITRKDVFYDRSQFGQICCYCFDANLHIKVPPPAILKPQRLWTGKQIFGVLINPEGNVDINLETKNRSFDKSAVIPDLCPNDGYVVFRNGELMCGGIDKAIIGDGNKNSVFYVMLRDFGPAITVTTMGRLAKLCARWLGNRGFSLGINDVQPGRILREKKDKVVERGYEECDQLITQSATGQLENQPGCNQEETLESHISGVLSKIRDDVGQICLQELSKHNAPLIMSVCGSKGSKINVSQMVACVGQQIISGKRIPNGFIDRSLPHFFPNAKAPAAKGFVRNSFYTGLSPSEFLFHAVSGREGLVDTAVKTAETGYMQRRLMKALEDLTIQYDLSVRDSVGGLVQFCYGDDGLDPANIEGDNKPVEFSRNLKHCIASVEGGLPLSPEEILCVATEELKKSAFVKGCTEAYTESIRNFIETSLVQPINRLREKYGAMHTDSRTPIDNILSITRHQLEAFFNVCLRKYNQGRIDPGTAVGALGAQSIGEPGTQMTLKTFHFAGVASMNVTLGVPRIKEIINATHNISTPIVTAKLVNSKDVKSARIIKGRIEKTMLSDVAEYIEECHHPREGSYLNIKVDLDCIFKLQLEVDIFSIAASIGKAPKIKIPASAVHVPHSDLIRVYVNEGEETFYRLKTLKRAIGDVVIKGYSDVQRAVISEGNGGIYELLVEGNSMLDVMGTMGVVGAQTTSNNIVEVYKTLGIEAARNTIIHEIQYTMGKHGMTIDPRHVMLLGDTMTCKGEVLGITRFGIAKMKDSVLMLASFEKTTDHLFDAAFYGRKDPVEGVSECIIMGIPMPIGTGLFKILQDQKVEPMERTKPLFE